MIRAAWPGTRWKQIRETLIAVALSILTFLFLFWVLISSAIAHMAASGWAYPIECCSGHDCAVIDSSRIKTAFAGYMVDGQFYVPMGQVRRSPDSDFHGCFPTKQTIGCFWAPPQGS